MRRGLQRLIVAIGLVAWLGTGGPGPLAAGWTPSLSAAGALPQAAGGQGRALDSQPVTDEPASDLDLARLSRAAAWAAAGFGALAFVLLIAALISRRVRRRHRVRRRSVYGVELPRNRISG